LRHGVWEKKSLERKVKAEKGAQEKGLSMGLMNILERIPGSAGKVEETAISQRKGARKRNEGKGGKGRPSVHSGGRVSR